MSIKPPASAPDTSDSRALTLTPPEPVAAILGVWWLCHYREELADL